MGIDEKRETINTLNSNVTDLKEKESKNEE